MKKINIAYWIVTVLFAGFMIFSSIESVLMTPRAITFLTGLGYPEYIIPFLGVAKILGSIAILIPGFPRLKEWAYAGLFFDLVGAVYTVTCVYGIQPDSFGIFPPIIFLFASYFLWHKRQGAQAASTVHA